MDEPDMSMGRYLFGKVRRWHTTPGLDQNVADHSFGVAVIISLLHKSPSANLLKEALFHDAGELSTGDFPSDMKDSDDDFHKMLEKVEAKARNDLGIPQFPLTENERKWIKFADQYEALLFLCTVANCHNITLLALTERITSKVTKLFNDLDTSELMEGASVKGARPQ